ncbi:MAG: hypothetical protein IJY67_01485 [Paludibacteraceae bacterium]|nr:hypothetical protein [Paludibacteraceae bacterium]
MDSIDKFFEIEMKYRLFDIKTDDGFYLWDIIRYDAYLQHNDIICAQKQKEKVNLLFLKKLFIAIFLFLKSFFVLFFKKTKYLIFSSNRYLDSDGRLFDKAIQNIVDELKGKSINLDNLKPLSKYKNNVYFNLLFVYRSLFFRKKSISDEIYHRLNNAFIEFYGESKLTKEDIEYIYSMFLCDYKYYSFYLKKIKPKAIFYVLNGIQKALLLAAKRNNIYTCEIQHGSVRRVNIVYSYPKGINSNSNIIFPDVFLSMGENAVIQPINMPAEIIPIGNNYYVFDSSKEKVDDSILVISTTFHSKYLIPHILEFAKDNPFVCVKYKLHPQEYFKESYYEEIFKGVSNIKILKGEEDINVLVARSSMVVLIFSTVAYEALNQGKKIAILQELDYMSMDDIFDLPNVSLFNSSESLFEIYKKNTELLKVPYFEVFNKYKFDCFLQMIDSKSDK